MVTLFKGSRWAMKPLKDVLDGEGDPFQGKLGKGLAFSHVEIRFGFGQALIT